MAMANAAERFIAVPASDKTDAGPWFVARANDPARNRLVLASDVAGVTLPPGAVLVWKDHALAIALLANMAEGHALVLDGTLVSERRA
jgi:hypothetical protein